MMETQKNNKGALVDLFREINGFFNENREIPDDVKHKTLMLIDFVSKEKEEFYIPKVSDLKIRHNCYHTLKRSFNIISKETSVALLNSTDENLAIIMGQFIVLDSLDKHLTDEEIPIEILNEMNNRTVVAVNESFKVFRKINHKNK